MLWLYTNYSGDRVVFRDLLPASRPYGSNESEEHISEDPAELRDAKERCETGCIEATAFLSGGHRFYYPKPRTNPFGDPERDWTEDFSHENGNYSCRCFQCGLTFVGHKRRVQCRKCANPSAQ
jgi:hypothetical protein